MVSAYNSHGGRATAYGNSYHPYRDSSDATSLLDDLRAFLARAVRLLWRFWKERGRQMVRDGLVSSARQLRRNLTYTRLVSFPHLLVGLWVVVLLWGERWVFHTKVESCHWGNWEKWVSTRAGDGEGILC